MEEHDLEGTRIALCMPRVWAAAPFTTDASGRHTLMVDPANVQLLCDVGWTVALVRDGWQTVAGKSYVACAGDQERALTPSNG